MDKFDLCFREQYLSIMTDSESDMSESSEYSGLEEEDSSEEDSDLSEVSNRMTTFKIKWHFCYWTIQHWCI